MGEILSLCANCFEPLEPLEMQCAFCGYELQSSEALYPDALLPGSVLNGQYIVGRVLGQGGFGITYLALDYSLNTRVAIKEYLPNGCATRGVGSAAVTVYAGEKQAQYSYGAERFLEEARLLVRFSGNKNIVAAKNFFSENGTSYYVMDYIEGISLKSYIKNAGGRISPQQAQKYLQPLMQPLGELHKVGLIHRDVTPDNIYITKQDEVKLLDFGSARYSLGEQSHSLDVILKAGYAPKEQYMRRSKQGAFTDVYSLGACFYASITGLLPPEALERLEKDELQPLSAFANGISKSLNYAVDKALAVQPEDRFASMQEFSEAIESQKAPSISAKKKFKKTSFWYIYLALFVVVFSAVFLGYSNYTHSQMKVYADKENYKEAISYFKKAPWLLYYDSNFVYYITARVQLQNGELQEARHNFDYLKGYKDSDSFTINIDVYLNAAKYEDSEKPLDMIYSYGQFLKVQDFIDSKARADTLADKIYSLALEYFNEDLFEAAKAKFEVVKNHKDAFLYLQNIALYEELLHIDEQSYLDILEQLNSSGIKISQSILMTNAQGFLYGYFSNEQGYFFSIADGHFETNIVALVYDSYYFQSDGLTNIDGKSLISWRAIDLNTVSMTALNTNKVYKLKRQQPI